MNWVLAALGGYLGLQVAIGAWLAPRIKSESDYLIAGRKLGYPLTIFSLFATWFGAESCISSAGRVYEEGFSLTSAEPFAYGITHVLTTSLQRTGLTAAPARVIRSRYGVATPVGAGCDPMVPVTR